VDSFQTFSKERRGEVKKPKTDEDSKKGRSYYRSGGQGAEKNISLKNGGELTSGGGK